MHEDFRRPSGDGQIEDRFASSTQTGWESDLSSARSSGQPDDGIRWEEYEFNFDDEFGTPRPAAPRRSADGFSVDAMRRLHESSADTETGEAYDDPFPQYDVKSRRPRQRKGRFLRLLLTIPAILLLLLALFCGGLWVLAKAPQTEQPIGSRREGCAVILLAGTDAEGTRTDTMMLLYLDLPGRSMRLLSLPRDTMVNRDNPVPKLNGAYAANGWRNGEFDSALGMDVLMDYAKDLVGYRPDGYMLIDLDCFIELVDLMGGVDYDVPMAMHYEDPYQDLYIDLPQGQQHLNGEQAMWLVRFRSGYAMADLERVNVQRSFLSEAARQWTSVWKLYKLPFALGLLSKHTITDLSVSELAWVAKAVALCRSDFESDTLPGTPETVNGGAYYVEDVRKAAALVNEKYNPYAVEITADLLHPYGK